MLRLGLMAGKCPLTSKSCQQLVTSLLEYGLTPAVIASLLGSRVSARTIYRWSKGESKPQQQSDFVALENLAATLTFHRENTVVDETKESC